VRRLLAHESTLGFWTVVGAVTFPVAHGFLTNGLTCGRGVGTLSMALRVAAHSLTLGTTTLFAVLDRTSHFALGFAALDLTLGTAKLLAAGGTLGRFADRFADLITNWTVTFPLTLRVAIITLAAVRTAGGRSTGKNHKRREQEQLHRRGGAAAAAHAGREGLRDERLFSATDKRLGVRHSMLTRAE